ncbi:MAG: hypothetical protein GY934_10695, partial [Gammaproteobacteria bacterium]|nr:hypothetical protein [Gammaproteobacteria bacterium]
TNGKWNRIYEFLLQTICNSDGQAYAFLIRFIAHALQKPEEKPGIIIIMLGGQGTGKGTLGRILMKMWSSSYLQVHDVGTVTGNFNSALELAFIVFMDEAFFVGDRRASDALKSLVTEPVIQINEKYQPSRQSKSYHRFFVASNADHVKHTEKDDRRDFVLRVSDKHKRDFAYWEALHHEIDNGGVKAMAHDLLQMDLSDFNVRDKPQTAELLEQKIQSLDPIPAWWYDRLYQSDIQSNDSWPDFIATIEAIDGIVEFAGRQLYKKPHPRQFNRVMRQLCPSVAPGQNTDNFGKTRGLNLPVLEVARREFETYIGGNIDWEDQ